MSEELSPEQQNEQDDAAFSAGFESTGAIEVAPDKPKQDDAVVETTAVEQPVQTEQPVLTLEDLQKQLETERAEKKKLEHERSAAVGHAAAAQRRVRELEAVKESAKTASAAPSQTQITEASAAGSEKWRKVKEDIPDWAEAFEERLSEIAPPKLDEEALQKRVSDSITPTLREQLRAELRAEAIQEARELARIDSKHPEWEVTVKEEGFRTWVSVQPPEVQALASSSKAGDAIRMLDLYSGYRKQHQAKTKQQERLSSAVTPKGSGAAPGPSVLDDEAAFSAGFNS